MRELKRQDRKEEVIPPHLTSKKELDKHQAIRQQLDSNTTSNKTAIGQQLDSNTTSNKTAIGQQLDSNKNYTKVQLDSNCTADWTADRIAIRQQLDSNWTAIRDVSILTGKEAELVKIVFQNCQNLGSLETPNLSTEKLKEFLGISTKRLGNLVGRLVKKQVFEVIFSKRGNGGFRRFKLLPEHYQKLTLDQKDSNKTAIRQQLDSNCTADWIADWTAKPPSSSSSDLLIKKLIKKNTTTTTPLDEGLGIDIPDNLKEIGFGASQISHVFNNARNPLTPQELQDSLDAFSYDLKQELIKPKTSPLNFLMGVLLKRGAYTSEAILIESKKEIESYMKTIKELEISMEDLKSVNKQKQFEKWLKTIPDDERNKIVPPSPLIKTGSRYQLVMLKDYWEKEINPNNS